MMSAQTHCALSAKGKTGTHPSGRGPGMLFRIMLQLEELMSAEPVLTSDVIGLTKAAPFSGAEDTGIPVATAEALKAALAANNKTAEFKIYPGAPHDFHADYCPSYRKEADQDGWNQMQAWLKKYHVLG
jgi:acetyl esterase/lipase